MLSAIGHDVDDMQGAGTQRTIDCATGRSCDERILSLFGFHENWLRNAIYSDFSTSTRTARPDGVENLSFLCTSLDGLSLKCKCPENH